MELKSQGVEDPWYSDLRFIDTPYSLQFDELINYSLLKVDFTKQRHISVLFYVYDNECLCIFKVKQKGYFKAYDIIDRSFK